MQILNKKQTTKLNTHYTIHIQCIILFTKNSQCIKKMFTTVSQKLL